MYVCMYVHCMGYRCATIHYLVCHTPSYLAQLKLRPQLEDGTRDAGCDHGQAPLEHEGDGIRR
eukprot:COSAG01_NODE_3520_length_5979_cov_3.900170_3_plen_63_part_00